MKVEHAKSIAGRVLEVIGRSSEKWIDTSEIYAQVAEAENITIISVSCRDLTTAEKVERKMIGGRWRYRVKQLDLLAVPSPAAFDEAPDFEERSEHRARGATRKAAALKVPVRSASIASPTRAIKLRVIDRLTSIVAEDIAAVLRSIRSDVEHA